MCCLDRPSYMRRCAIAPRSPAFEGVEAEAVGDQLLSQDMGHSFDGWFGHQPPAVRSAAIVRDVAAGIDLVIRHGGIQLHGHIHEHGLSVAAEHDGECWDFLLDLDVLPAPVNGGGYQCRSCPADDRLTFPNLDALWADHLFQPLAEWVQEKLLPARALAFFRHGGATWARLVQKTDDIDGASIVVWA